MRFPRFATTAFIALLTPIEMLFRRHWAYMRLLSFILFLFPHSCVQEFSKSRQFLWLARLEKVHSRAIDERLALVSRAHHLQGGARFIRARDVAHVFLLSARYTPRKIFSHEIFVEAAGMAFSQCETVSGIWRKLDPRLE
jgi:hypothetical protein